MNAGKPLSNTGCLYLFACHMLYTAAQSYYGFGDDEAVHMSQISRRAWISIAEDIIGWTIEEIAFCLNREKVPPAQAKHVEDFAELRDARLFHQVNDKILASSARLHQIYPAIAVENYVYSCYCRFLFRVLLEFGMIMDDKSMRSARYIEHYRRDIALFKGLAKELEKEFARDGDVPSTIVSGLEATAVELSAEWRKAIYSAVADVFAGAG